MSNRQNDGSFRGTFSADAVGIQDPGKLQELLIEKSREMVNDHFIVIELYNSQKEKLKEIVKPEKELVEKVLKQYDHQFPMGHRDDPLDCKSFFFRREGVILWHFGV